MGSDGGRGEGKEMEGEGRGGGGELEGCLRAPTQARHFRWTSTARSELILHSCQAPYWCCGAASAERSAWFASCRVYSATEQPTPLLLVCIDEVELVKQQLFSLILTLGRNCTTLMAASLTGPFSAVLGPRHDSCWCLIMAVRPSCSSRQVLRPRCSDGPETWRPRWRPSWQPESRPLPDAGRLGWARNLAVL